MSCGRQGADEAARRLVVLSCIRQGATLSTNLCLGHALSICFVSLYCPAEGRGPSCATRWLVVLSCGRQGAVLQICPSWKGLIPTSDISRNILAISHHLRCPGSLYCPAEGRGPHKLHHGSLYCPAKGNGPSHSSALAGRGFPRLPKSYHFFVKDLKRYYTLSHAVSLCRMLRYGHVIVLHLA